MPIFKNGRNYRPISIIAIFVKIFEFILKPWVSKFIEGHKRLDYRQWLAYEYYRPCQTVVAEIISGSGKDHNTTLGFCDLCKAFDCVVSIVFLILLKPILDLGYFL